MGHGHNFPKGNQSADFTIGPSSWSQGSVNLFSLGSKGSWVFLLRVRGSTGRFFPCRICRWNAPVLRTNPEGENPLTVEGRFLPVWSWRGWVRVHARRSACVRTWRSSCVLPHEGVHPLWILMCLCMCVFMCAGHCAFHSYLCLCMCVWHACAVCAV